MVETYLSVEDVIDAFPGRVRAMLDDLDLTTPGLEDVSRAIEDGRVADACWALLRYYRDKSSCSWLFSFEGADRNQDASTPEDIFSDTFVINKVKARVPRREDGGLDWSYCGPHGDREWGWGLNRHFFLLTLVDAWKSTGDARNLGLASELLQDWIVSNPPPGTTVMTPQWRALETALRLTHVWCRFFFEDLPAKAFPDSTRLLMLVSILEQASYVCSSHVPARNILIMELVSLLVVSASFPEFKQCKPRITSYQNWIREQGKWPRGSPPCKEPDETYPDYSFPRIQGEILEVQVYPDGVLKELTEHYHEVVEHFVEITLYAAKEMKVSLVPEFRQRAIAMLDYLALHMRPDGTSLLNNDSDLDDWRQKLLDRASVYGKDDWVYICTNGQAGKPPVPRKGHVLSPTGQSVMFTWAGHVIMRDGWNKLSQWAFLDVGPFGTGHQHRDKLHLSVNALGHQWLVDSGRYWYVSGTCRDLYFQATRAHNTAGFGMFGQLSYERETKKSLESQFISTREWDYAIGEYSSGYGFDYREITAIPDFEERFSPMLEKMYADGLLEPVGFATLKEPNQHSRVVIYVRGKCWLVVDQITVGVPRDAEIYWHFHPACEVSIIQGSGNHNNEPGKIVSPENTHGTMIEASQPILGELEPDTPGDGKDRFYLVPILEDGADPPRVEIVKGVGGEFPQGWWSRAYGCLEPAPCAVFTIPVETTRRVGWLLVPRAAGQDAMIPRARPVASFEPGKASYEIDGLVFEFSMDCQDPWCQVLDGPDADESKRESKETS